MSVTVTDMGLLLGKYFVSIDTYIATTHNLKPHAQTDKIHAQNALVRGNKLCQLPHTNPCPPCSDGLCFGKGATDPTQNPPAPSPTGTAAPASTVKNSWCRTWI